MSRGGKAWLLLMLALLLAGCGTAPAAQQQGAAVQGDPLPPGPGGETESIVSSETESQEPGIAVGRYVYTDGTALTVEQDGSLTYEPVVYGWVAGVPVAGLVTFYGTVDEQGQVSLERALYRGVNITKEAARSGFSIEEEWVGYAQAMYEGLAYFGSVDLSAQEPMQMGGENH